MRFLRGRCAPGAGMRGGICMRGSLRSCGRIKGSFMSNLHELKCWPELFDPVINGEKRFDVRRNDRGFLVGDALLLREWDPETSKYTDRAAIVWVPYIVEGGQFGIADDHVVMSIELASVIV